MYRLFAWRYFKAPKQANAINIIAWVTVCVIAFTTACQVLVLSVFNGFEDLVKSLYGAFYTDIRVVPAKGKIMHADTLLLQQIRQHPEVAVLAPVIEERALLQHEELQTVIELKGVDSNYSQVCGVAGKTVQGKFLIGNAEQPGLILGAGVQYAVAARIDGPTPPSIVNLVLPKKAVVSVSDPLQALSEGHALTTGIFSIQQDFDNQYAITNLDFMKQQIGLADHEFSALEIKLKPEADPTQVQTQLQQQLGTAFLVKTRYEQNSSLYNTMKMEKWVIYAVLTLILLVAAFNMISALTMLVLEKQKDISILRSFGCTGGMIRRIFLTEGLLLGGIGLGSGLILATVIGLLQVKFKLLKLQGGSFLVDYFPVNFQLVDYLLVAALAFIITLAAAWMPAKKAAGQPLQLKS